MEMPGARSSGSRSVSTPVSARTSTVLPWSMCPAVPRVSGCTPGTLAYRERMTRRRGGRLETAALAVLALGWLLPGIGWLVGAGLVAASRVWSLREKLVGVIGMVLLAGVGWGIPVGFQTHSDPLPIVVESLGFGGVFGALYLWRRLRLEPSDL